MDLVDAKAMAKRFPGFYSPDDCIIDLLRSKDLVKVSNGQERFWVMVNRRVPDGSFVGSIRNNIVTAENYGWGDQIKFTAANIYDIDLSKPTKIFLRKYMTIAKKKKIPQDIGMSRMSAAYKYYRKNNTLKGFKIEKQ